MVRGHTYVLATVGRCWMMWVHRSNRVGDDPRKQAVPPSAQTLLMSSTVSHSTTVRQKSMEETTNESKQHTTQFRNTSFCITTATNNPGGSIQAASQHIHDSTGSHPSPHTYDSCLINTLCRHAACSRIQRPAQRECRRGPEQTRKQNRPLVTPGFHHSSGPNGGPDSSIVLHRYAIAAVAISVARCSHDLRPISSLDSG